MDRRLAEQRVAVVFIVRNRRADLRPAGWPGRVRRARKRNAGDGAVVAKPELVAARSAIAIVEGTDDPVDGTAKRGGGARVRRDAEFLSELLGPLIAELIDRVERRAFEVAAIGDAKLLEGADRRDRREARIIFRACDIAFGLAVEIEIGRAHV